MNPTARPEILAPAGDRAALEAAVRAGADAVYFGLSAWNARARATNFDLDTLPATVDHLHRHGVKAYVTLNTLVFDDELPALASAIRAIAAAAVDAVIVQDLGLARMVKAIAPSLRLHASTQMTCTDADSVAFAASLGAERVVLARELSLADIAAIRAESDVELEVFVHGALCIAYSGQCLTSEAIGGRSANRGACAQACRLPYELIVDGQVVDTGAHAYLLSPGDLEASSLVPALREAGVSSFKIEGRLKDADYVAAATRLYRQAVAASVGEAAGPDRGLREAALLAYSRGSGPGFLQGVDHQSLVEGRQCEHQGLPLGRVSGVSLRGGRAWLAVDLHAEATRGQGLLVEGGRASQGERGGRIWNLLDESGHDVKVAAAGTQAFLWLGPEVDLGDVVPGRRVFRTSDPAADRRIAALRAAMPEPRIGVDIEVSGSVGAPPRLRARVDAGAVVEAKGDAPITIAHTRPLDQAGAAAQLGRLGGTPFFLRSLDWRLPTGTTLPVSSLNRARRELIAALATRLSRVHETTAVTLADLCERARPPVAPPPPAGLFVLCRTLAQAEAALEAGADGVYLDFLELTGTGAAFRQLRARAAPFVGLAPPRIRKPGEEKIDRYLSGLSPDAVLVRGLGALAQLSRQRGDGQGPLAIGDFSLNVTNQLTAALALEQGLAAFTPSFDLNATQLERLLAGAFAPFAEVVVHHPMPLFHMEHCLIAARLSQGRDHLSCGRPCERHRVSLRDRAGHEHPVEADVGCRNTVFHASAQSAAACVPALRTQGVRRFRIELVREDAAAVVNIVTAYRALLAGTMTPKALWRTLRTEGGYGVVSGSLRVLG